MASAMKSDGATARDLVRAALSAIIASLSFMSCPTSNDPSGSGEAFMLPPWPEHDPARGTQLLIFAHRDGRLDAFNAWHDALHEAAHAVAAIRAGLPVKVVTLDPEEIKREQDELRQEWAAQGKTRPPDEPGIRGLTVVPGDPDEQPARAYAQHVYAAARLTMEVSSEQFPAEDLHRHICAVYFNTKVEWRHAAIELLKGVRHAPGFGQPEWQDTWEAFEADVVAQLKKDRSVILLVAEALVVARTIAGDSVRRIVETSALDEQTRAAVLAERKARGVDALIPASAWPRDW
jgi:hypothetical protein